MLKALVISQGGLSRELVAAAERIAGNPANLIAVSLGWDDDVETARGKIADVLADQAAKSEVLLLVDMVGSTPYNAAQGLVDGARVELLAGVNLPMLVRLGCQASEPLSAQEAAEVLQLKGQASIRRGEAGGGSGRLEICPPEKGEGE